jgi:ribosomal protein L35
MEHTSRLYYCALCHTQSVICSRCDRGQIYCSDTCAKTARLKSCREAEKRYQLTLKGKHKHAARQKRYLIRQKEKVTDQGSVTATHNALLEQVKNKTKEVDMGCVSRQQSCCVCKHQVSSWLRTGFLRYYSSKSGVDLSYLRPP